VLRHCTRRLIPIGVAGAFYFVSRFVLSALGDPPNFTLPPAELVADKATSAAAATTAPPDQSQSKGAPQSYVGTNKCFICHRRQTDAWSETKHAHAFTDVPEKYRNDAACLKCHLTAFGESSGYVAGTDKDLLMVGCEACHGPGARHADAAQRFVLANPGEEAKIEQEMRATIVKAPQDTVCAACHKVQGHQKHPAYDGPSSSKDKGTPVVVCDPTLSIVPSLTSTAQMISSLRYSTKTCGGCHYVQYKRWSAERHSALSRMLPAKYLNDQSCQNCHPTANALVSSAGTIADPRNWIGVACESCHGPALEHVRFNRQYIDSPPFGPKLEQAARQLIRKGKPENTCVLCHARNGHKEHVPFEGH
jgi:hypothetical protein